MNTQEKWRDEADKGLLGALTPMSKKIEIFVCYLCRILVANRKQKSLSREF